MKPNKSSAGVIRRVGVYRHSVSASKSTGLEEVGHPAEPWCSVNPRYGLTQVGQLGGDIVVVDSVRGDFARELLTTFVVSNKPFWRSQACGQLDAEAVEENGLCLVRRGDAADVHVASRRRGKHDIRGLDASELLDERAWAVAKS